MNTSQLPALDTLADADVVAAMEVPYTPKGHPEYPNDDYRCFLIEAPTDTDRYVQGFEIFPGEPAEVHHMLMFSIVDQEGEDDVRARDAAEEGPGWECFSTPFDEHVSFLAGWAPGTNVMRYPEETGVYMAGGRPLVMQIHYNLLAGTRPDTTSVTLKTVAEVTKEAALVPIPFTDVIYDLRLPPGHANAKQEFSQALFGLADDLELHGVFPHMHTLGTKMHFSVRQSGQAREDAMCLTDVWRWDFHWQQLFLYDDPLVIRPSDYLDLSCEYDTRGRDTDTTWGEGTQDEMCLMFVYITRLGGGPLSELLE
jgi:hypothetical protein